MTNSAQKRALRNYRSRLKKRGITRFEVLGLVSDRDLIRTLARRLAEGGPDARPMRATLSRAMIPDSPQSSGVLQALRRSPLARSNLDLKRLGDQGRSIDL